METEMTEKTDKANETRERLTPDPGWRPKAFTDQGSGSYDPCLRLEGVIRDAGDVETADEIRLMRESGEGDVGYALAVWTLARWSHLEALTDDEVCSARDLAVGWLDDDDLADEMLREIERRVRRLLKDRPDCRWQDRLLTASYECALGLIRSLERIEDPGDGTSYINDWIDNPERWDDQPGAAVLAMEFLLDRHALREIQTRDLRVAVVLERLDGYEESGDRVAKELRLRERIMRRSDRARRQYHRRCRR